MTNEEIIQCVRSKYVTEGQVDMYTIEQIGFMLNMLRIELQREQSVQNSMYKPHIVTDNERIFLNDK